ncbi:MAG TPA: STAS domain-containing protein, partial [Holophaga sp.]|nr:STAS domain-containing protein [Holophaga sp.]
MTSPKPSLTAKKKGEALRLKPRTDLVASTVEGHRGAMLQAIEAGGESVVLDLSDVDLIDSLGITLVLGLFKSCQKAGIRFSIEGVKPDL